MGNFYLCNEINFLMGMGMSKKSPSNGTHMKMSAVNDFLKKHPTYSYVKVRNTSKGNDYVISTPMKFLGNDNNTVNAINKAKPFASAEEAYEYLDLNSEKIDKDIHIVVDEKYNRKKRTAPKIEVGVDPGEVMSFAKMDSSDRIKIPAKIKNEVYRLSGGVCPICGLPLSKYKYTVDHKIPLSRGGTNELENLRAVHHECNRLKGNFLDNEMNKGAVSVTCNKIIDHPTSELTAMVIRSFMRGIINKYGGLKE